MPVSFQNETINLVDNHYLAHRYEYATSSESELVNYHIVKIESVTKHLSIKALRLKRIDAFMNTADRVSRSIDQEWKHLAYERLCKKVYKAVLIQFEVSNELHKRFVPYGAAAQILNNTFLGELFDLLCAVGDQSKHVSSVNNDDMISRARRRNVQPLLAVLLFSRCDMAAISACLAKLLLVDDDTWTATNLKRKALDREPLGTLPLDSAHASEIFGARDYETLDRIATNQTMFCPVQLWKNGERLLNSTQQHRFPYLEEEAIGEGYSGKVFRVVIAKGFFFNKDEDSINNNDVLVARKDYDSKKNNQFAKAHMGTNRRIQEEKEIIQLLNKFRKHPNIVQTLGAYELGPIYSLFLELATKDLKSYLSSREEKLTSPEAKAEFLRCAAGLASGLNFLHKGIRLPGCDRAVCYHLDLKPDNILVYKGVDEGGNETMTWKISDFSEARLKTSGERDQVKHRPRTWFLLRKEYSAFSGTQNRRLQGTYLAPESEQSQPVMGAHSDVWSLGCIMSVLFTFLESGWRGIGDYSDQRIHDRQVQQSDQFFRPSLGWSSFKLNSKVTDQHERLVHQAEKREQRDQQALQGESEAIKHFLDFLEDDVLIINWKSRQANTRASAEIMGLELMRLVEFYELQQCVPSQTVIQSDSATILTKLGGLARSILSPPVLEQKIATDAESWFNIPAHAGIKASTIAAAETIIAFWSNEYVRLYAPNTLDLEPNSKGLLSSYGVQDKLGQNTCYWESVDINSRCLVASTSSSQFECYFYELEDYDTMGISLNTKHRVFQRLPKIRRVAVSPDNKWFVCVINSEIDSDQPGTLCIAAMNDVLDGVRHRRSNSLQENVLQRVTNSKSLISWSDTQALHASALDLTNLVISEQNIVFAVLQPSIRAESYEHYIILHSFDLSKRRFCTINLKNPPLEYSNVSFFTTFAPFHTQNACAIVTREHGFHVQYFTDAVDTRDVVQSIYSHRLLDIVLDLDDDTVYAVGTRSANSDVLLLRFPLPHSNERDIRITEIERLRKIVDDDDCTLSISLKDGHKYIVISVARGIIYRKDLSQLLP